MTAEPTKTVVHNESIVHAFDTRHLSTTRGRDMAMTSIFAVLAILAAAALVFLLAFWRFADSRRDQTARDELLGLARTDPPARFDPQMVAGLPEPARRYFRHVIDDGAPLGRAVELEMRGTIGLGDKADPRYRPMRARQLLVPPHGLVWQVEAGGLSGSDGITPATSWTRFWLFRLAPVVHVSGHDHHRSAFGRLIAEAAFWSPASLLPGDHVHWAAVDDETARATVRFGDQEQAVDITVDDDGAPRSVRIERWSNANPDGVFRLQPFGGRLSEYRAFDGYRLPTRVEGGNHFGTDAYFPFYKVEVTRARVITPDQQAAAWARAQPAKAP